MTVTHAVRRPHRWAPLVATAVAAALLAGCGTEVDEPETADQSPTIQESPSPSASPTTPTEPRCGDVWVAGKKFRGGYQGCLDAEAGEWVPAEVVQCSSGQRIVTFGETFYAVKGRGVVETRLPLVEDPEYAQVLAACTA